MSHVKEITLLEYVIAYLQEEATRYDNQKRYSTPLSMEGVEALLIKRMVANAIDAYEGGAR